MHPLKQCGRASPALRALAALFLGGLWSPVVGAAAAGPAAGGFENYITRQGARLYDGEKEFRFVGANMPGMMLPYDFTLFLPERMSLPTPWEQEDGFKTLAQMNLRVLRLWNLPIRGPQEEAKPWHYVLGPGEFNEAAFKVLDRVFALAHRYGIRLIVPLTAEAGDFLGGIGTYAAHRGQPRAAFYTDPQIREDYKATLRYVLNRTNTITGVRYCDDKSVLAWQFGNEMHTAPDAWLAEMAAYMKALAPRQLVAETRHLPTKPMYVDANIDLVTLHLYPDYSGIEGGWSAATRRQLAKLTEKRPLFIGEFGAYIDGKMFTADNLVAKVREFLDYAQSEPSIAGTMLWSMYFHHRDGGFYWHQIFTYPSVWTYHWPGFPSGEAQREQGFMQAIREAAFRIEGKPVPPLPLPDAPELLPFAGVPLFSWRGSAGAMGYDIERAAQLKGPWRVLVANMSDADVAYRPLFSDTTARAGETWFYRVVARNTSGVSPPSNVVGPVEVRQVCLIDELQDFSPARGRSAGLVLNNSFNAVYAEYLFRAKGNAQDWISYEVPAAIERVNIAVFFGEMLEDMSAEVSRDGVTFSPLPLERNERRLPNPPGGAARGQRRTLVEYHAMPPAGYRHLRLLWQGAAELDRVEIYHAGGK